VRQPRGRRAGFALLIALVVLLLVFEAGGLVASGLAARLRIAREDRSRVVLDALEDASLADALARLDADRGYSGVSERDFGSGHLWSDVERVGVQRWSIEASATVGGERRAVEAEARLDDAGLRVVAWRVRFEER
jgi:hypothetical protein